MSWLGRLFGSAGSAAAAAASSSPAGYPPLPAGVEAFFPGGQEATFHASTTVSGRDPRSGAAIFRSGIGASLVSREDARRIAKQNAEQNLARTLAGESTLPGSYAYFVSRQLEPVVELLTTPGSAEAAAKVTINSYGALIINARSALFVDVDTRASDDGPDDPGADDGAAARLREVVTKDPELAFRVYRTRNGWRYLCTSRLFDPMADETAELLKALHADAKYATLCRVQRCFRARLTPKPWRIGHRFFNVHPTEKVTRGQLERYLKKAAPYATTAFTAEVGAQGSPSPPELRRIIGYHDAWCAAASGKPLA